MILFLKRFSMLNMLNCTVQCQWTTHTHTHTRARMRQKHLTRERERERESVCVRNVNLRTTCGLPNINLACAQNLVQFKELPLCVKPLARWMATCKLRKLSLIWMSNTWICVINVCRTVLSPAISHFCGETVMLGITCKLLNVILLHLLWI